MGLRGCEVEVDGVALLLLLVGRAGARDVGLQVDALVTERVDPFAGLVRVDDVDDNGFVGGCADCDVELRLERLPTARSADSATVGAYVVGAGFGRPLACARGGLDA